jgi:hypothetical protein
MVSSQMPKKERFSFSSVVAFPVVTANRTISNVRSPPLLSASNKVLYLGTMESFHIRCSLYLSEALLVALQISENCFSV